jgi:hypothetical protein
MPTQRVERNKKLHLPKYRTNLRFLLKPTKATYLSLYSSIFNFFNFLYIYIDRKSDMHTIIYRVQPLLVYTHI